MLLHPTNTQLHLSNIYVMTLYKFFSVNRNIGLFMITFLILEIFWILSSFITVTVFYNSITADSSPDMSVSSCLVFFVLIFVFLFLATHSSADLQAFTLLSYCCHVVPAVSFWLQHLCCFQPPQKDFILKFKAPSNTASYYKAVWKDCEIISGLGQRSSHD